MRIKLKRITPVCILCNEEETGFEILNRAGSRHAPLEPRTDAREKRVPMTNGFRDCIARIGCAY